MEWLLQELTWIKQLQRYYNMQEARVGYVEFFSFFFNVDFLMEIH